MDSSQRRPEILRVLPSKQETRAFYNKISGVYDILAERTEGPMRDEGIEQLDLRHGDYVLEIGFGTGHGLAQLAEAVGERGMVFGLDLSEGMLAQARELLQERNLVRRVELTCGDGTRLPYAESSMDAVFLSFTLELFDTPEIPQVLAECKRVLRKGGRIGVVAISKEGPEGLAVEAYEWTHKHFPNLLDCRPIYVRRSLEEAGFRIRHSAIGKMWVPVEIVVGEKITD